MTEREREICARVRHVRLSIRWPKEPFADSMGLTLNQLKGIEYGQAVLRYEAADRLCRYFGVNQGWLATGAGRATGYARMLRATLDTIDRSELFSAIYDGVIREIVDAENAKAAEATARLKERWDRKLAEPQVRAALKKLALSEIESMADSLLERMPQSRWRGFVDRIRAGMSVFFHGPDKPVGDGLAMIADEIELPRVNKAATVGDVTLKSVLARLENAMNDCGGVTAVARALKMPKSTVSRYLSKQRTPGGEALLRIQEWLDQRDAPSAKPAK